MGKVERCMTCMDFLPNEGNIAVARSAISWVYSGGQFWRSSVGEVLLNRLENFGEVFEKRGNVLTGFEVLREMEERVKYFSERRGLSISERWRRELDKVYSALKKGKDAYDFGDGPVSLIDVREFSDRLGKLSSADKDVVSIALSMGDGNGILTADKPMMMRYEVGVEYFGLSDCFVCDIMKGETFSPDRKVYNFDFA